ncbi:Zinc finger protein ZOP1 [Camellia lanceoleosa]|uniref:Zinc finger protein ZOP1 n=1 Tax=Camellia lanceoleosa TaxID=1840588 RepID=A0ACC0HZ30_9ERIC|nr:Zinc finger protein ZOP1 [Camellia lanceoleosa]
MQPGLQSKAELIIAQEDGQGSVISGEGKKFIVFVLIHVLATCLLPNEVQLGIWMLELSCGSLYDYESLLEWEYDNSLGYYCNQNNGCFYDPNSGFYYTDALASKKPILKKPLSALEGRSTLENKGPAKSQNGVLPGLVVSAPLNPKRSIKGASSSLTVNKRKRQDEKPKVLSEEEAAALKKREAARKRVEEREKSLLGLYRQ